MLASVKRRHRPDLSLIHLDIGIDVARALPSVFGRMMRGAIFLEKMVRTFNRGMGMVFIVAGAEDKVGDALWVLAVYTSFRVNRRGQSVTLCHRAASHHVHEERHNGQSKTNVLLIFSLRK